MVKKIFQVILAIAIVALVYAIYKQISTPIGFENELATRKKAVIERIKDIRLAERQYKSKYQHFTADFDSLINFVLTEDMEG